MSEEIQSKYIADKKYDDLKSIIEEAIKELNIECNNTFVITPIIANVKGHYCTNILFYLKDADDIQNKIKDHLIKNEIIESVEIVKKYINITLNKKYFMNKVKSIISENIFPNIGNKAKVNVEYCSVNPTGYLHIGHARNAILGDSIAKILEKTNYDVLKEYYVNDGGNQINLMAESIYARLCEINNIDHTFPENGYKGQEMYDVAKSLPKDATIDFIKKHSVKFFLQQIKKDLKKINITYDSWVFESKIIEDQYIEKSLEILNEKGYIIHDTRSDKKVNKGDISSNKLMLLKTTELGDDLDRPLTKADGSWTYFAPDIGYHLYKIERGYEYLICILGADHDSYAKRIKIATKLLNANVIHKTPLCQMVSFENEGELIKFSKRMGNSIRISDFIKEINPDILRFMILEKSADTQFVFNYENAVNITMKNPLFYCQYAFARACSILRNAKEIFNYDFANNTKSMEIVDDFFDNESVQDFIITLDQFKTIIEDTAKNLAPHKLANYTKKLCEKMHKLWQIGKINKEHKIIIETDIEQTQNRIELIKAFIKVANECFYCLGITAKEEM